MNYSKVILCGRLSRQPELKSVGAAQVASFTIVVNDSKKEASFIECKAWNAVASKAESYPKGRLVIAEGFLKQESWIDKETGKNRSKLVVVITDISEPTVGLQQPLSNSMHEAAIHEVDELPF